MKITINKSEEIELTESQVNEIRFNLKEAEHLIEQARLHFFDSNPVNYKAFEAAIKCSRKALINCLH